MANNFEIEMSAQSATPSVANLSATLDVIPAPDPRPAVSFGPTTDQYIIFEGHIPAAFTGSGTLKLDLYACANTNTAADDARIDVATEFRTPGAAEDMSADNFDGTVDSGTFTFSTTPYSLRLLTITLTPATTPAAGDIFRLEVVRDANHATLDDLAVALLMPMVVLYEAA